MALSHKIRRRLFEKEYYRFKMQANLAGRELTKSLDEVLGVESDESEFDEQTDEALEKMALANLEAARCQAATKT